MQPTFDHDALCGRWMHAQDEHGPVCVECRRAGHAPPVHGTAGS